MKVIADRQIPYLNDFLSVMKATKITTVDRLTPDTIQNATALFVRSVTPVNAELLKHSSVQFVASASAGINHLDKDYLKQAGIAWAYAPGCNAQAVADYVLLVVAALAHTRSVPLDSLTAGVIGLGRVGQRVFDRLKKLKMKVVANDPPRAKKNAHFKSTPLQQFKNLDLICLHTPLTTTGEFPTYHLLTQRWLSELKEGCLLLNAGRGEVIPTDALKQATHLKIAVDVWENEPNIDLELLASAWIATPHIAGYSQLAKFRATQLIVQAYCQHFNLPFTPPTATPGSLIQPNLQIPLSLAHPQWIEQALSVENLLTQTHRLKTALLSQPQKTAALFEEFRKTYPLRPEFIT